MLALGVVTIGLLGIFTLLSKSFFYDRDITDQLTATYLASEGVEVAKSLIDSDMYSGAVWGSCFRPYENAAGVADLELDYLTTDCGSLTPYSPSAPTPLRFDPKIGEDEYGYAAVAGSVPTIFFRDVRVAQNGAEITVSSIVTWSTGPITNQSLVLEDHFYYWRP